MKSDRNVGFTTSHILGKYVHAFYKKAKKKLRLGDFPRDGNIICIHGAKTLFHLYGSALNFLDVKTHQSPDEIRHKRSALRVGRFSGDV